MTGPAGIVNVVVAEPALSKTTSAESAVHLSNSLPATGADAVMVTVSPMFAVVLSALPELTVTA